MAAEDVAQECFLELASARATIRTSVGGWLHSLATHRSLDRRRAERRRQRREQSFAESIPGAVEGGWDDVRAHVDEAIARLPDAQRHAVVAHYLEGRTYDAIAAEAGVSGPTVAGRARAGVEAIRRHLRRTGVIAPLAFFSTLATDAEATTAPASLVESLGKLAIAGGGSPSGAGVAFAGGVFMAKKIAIGVGALALVATAVLSLQGIGPRETEPPTQPVVERREMADVTEPSTSPEEPSARAAAKAVVEGTPDPIPPGDSVFHVYVADREGNPGSGAEIVLELQVVDGSGRKTYQRETRADADGAATFAALPLGRYLAIGRLGRLVGCTPATLREAFPTGSIDIILKPAGVIEGTVVTEAGTPIPGAEVRIFDSKDRHDGLRSTTTDEHGQFAFSDVPLGQYRLLATAEGFAPAFSPETKIDGPAMTVVLGPGATLQGSVWLAGSRTPVAGVAVDVVVEDFPYADMQAASDALGVFTIERMPEGVALITTNDKYALTPPQVTAELRAKTVASVDLYVEHGGQIAGTVYDAASGEPVEGAEVGARILPHRTRAWRSEPTGPDGQYMLTGLPSGEYTVQIVLLKSLPAPLVPITHTPELRVQVDAGGVTGGVDLEVDAGLMICGMVVDDAGNPVPRAQVAMGRHLPDQAEPFHYQTTWCNEAGEFCFANVDAGAPIVSLIADYRGARSMRTQPVLVEDSSHYVTLKLEPRPAGSIAGFVVDEDGAPAIAMLSLRQPIVTEGFDRRMARTDIDGRFVFQDLAPGDYEIWVSPDTGTGYPSRREIAQTLTLAANERVTDVRLVLKPGAEITGRITDERGNPLRGIKIEAYEVGSETDRDVSSDFTDRDGRFRIMNLVGEQFELWPSTAFAGPEWTVTAAAGEHVEIVLPDALLNERLEPGERTPIRPEEVSPE